MSDKQVVMIITAILWSAIWPGNESAKKAATDTAMEIWEAVSSRFTEDKPIKPHAPSKVRRKI